MLSTTSHRSAESAGDLALDDTNPKELITKMRDLRDTQSGPLGWHEAIPGASVHVLRDDHDVFARLEFSGATADGATAAGTWIITRGRDCRITVQTQSGLVLGATRQSQWTGRATFALTSGSLYYWRPANLLRTRWAFHSRSNGSDAVGIEPARGTNNSLAGVEVGIGAGGPDLDVLVLLARYLTVVNARDNGIAAAAAVVGS